MKPLNLALRNLLTERISKNLRAFAQTPYMLPVYLRMKAEDGCCYAKKKGIR